MCDNSTLTSDGLCSEQRAYEQARDLAKRVVGYAVVDAKTAGAAIDALSRKGGLGSWLLRLHRGDPVTIHLHYFMRLVALLDEQVKLHSQRLEHERAILEAIKGGTNEGSFGLVSASMDRAAARVGAV